MSKKNPCKEDGYHSYPVVKCQECGEKTCLNCDGGYSGSPCSISPEGFIACHNCGTLIPYGNAKFTFEPAV